MGDIVLIFAVSATLSSHSKQDKLGENNSEDKYALGYWKSKPSVNRRVFASGLSA